VRLDADALVKGLRATVFASSGRRGQADPHRGSPAARCHGLECAATDGHRLAVSKLVQACRPTARTPSEGEPLKSRCRPAPCGNWSGCSRAAPHDPLSLFCERGQVVVLSSDQVLTSRSLDGTYPNYRQLIPEAFNRSIQLDRRAFMAALERVAVLADAHNNVVKLSCDPVQRPGDDPRRRPGCGQRRRVPGGRVEGEAIEIAFNVRYLVDGIKAMNAERVSLRCNAPTTPAVLVPIGEEEAFTYLVMPVQISA
jgi:DNA polymerase-3 subunit beta